MINRRAEVSIKAITLVATSALAVLLGACVQQQEISGSTLAGRAASADDLLVVDCLLPGQVRKLGSQMTYVSARRPIQTSVQDCEIRGGEYVAYDRGSFASALGFWMPLAQPWQCMPESSSVVCVACLSFTATPLR